MGMLMGRDKASRIEYKRAQAIARKERDRERLRDIWWAIGGCLTWLLLGYMITMIALFVGGMGFLIYVWITMYPHL